MTRVSSSRGTALITGASTGIGAAYADRLAHRGYDLVLVARNHRRLEAVAAKLPEGVRSEILVADLTKTDDLARVEERVRDDASIALLVNNAGAGDNAPLAAAEWARLESMIQLNVTALTRLAAAGAAAFSARGGGAIVNIASIVALAPELLGATYSASKAYVLSLTQSMQVELKDKGIYVQAVLPGATDTELWELAGTPISTLPQEIVMNVDDLVDAALAGFDQREPVTIPSLPDAAQWDAFVAARRAMGPNLSTRKPASRYGVAA